MRPGCLVHATSRVRSQEKKREKKKKNTCHDHKTPPKTQQYGDPVHLQTACNGTSLTR